MLHCLVKSISDTDVDGERSAHSKIGPVRLFIGNLEDGTTEEEVKAAIEPIGEVKRIDVKVSMKT